MSLLNPLQDSGEVILHILWSIAIQFVNNLIFVRFFSFFQYGLKNLALHIFLNFLLCIPSENKNYTVLLSFCIGNLSW